MTNLRKCPKCGEEPVLITECDDSGRLDIHMYQCCGVNHNWNVTKDDCEDDWNYDEEVVDGEIEWLGKELKAERESLHEMCEGIRDNCRACMVKGIRRTLDSCSQCPTSRYSEKAVVNLKRLDSLK